MERRQILAETSIATVEGFAADACAVWVSAVVRSKRELFAQLDQLTTIRRENGLDDPDAEAIALECVLDVLCDVVLPEREFRELLGRWRQHDHERQTLIGNA